MSVDLASKNGFGSILVIKSRAVCDHLSLCVSLQTFGVVTEC